MGKAPGVDEPKRPRSSMEAIIALPQQRARLRPGHMAGSSLNGMSGQLPRKPCSTNWPASISSSGRGLFNLGAPPEKGPEVSRAVDHAKDLHAMPYGPVQNQHVFKIRDTKKPVAPLTTHAVTSQAIRSPDDSPEVRRFRSRTRETGAQRQDLLLALDNRHTLQGPGQPSA